MNCDGEEPAGENLARRLAGFIRRRNIFRLGGFNHLRRVVRLTAPGMARAAYQSLDVDARTNRQAEQGESDAREYDLLGRRALRASEARHSADGISAG